MTIKKKKLVIEEEFASMSPAEMEAMLNEVWAEDNDRKDDPLELEDNLAFQLKPLSLGMHKIFKKPENIKNPKEYIDPPSECSICKKSFLTEKYFIEGKLASSTGFLNMCEACFLKHGAGFGKDRG
jgi:hypothetical protein